MNDYPWPSWRYDSYGIVDERGQRISHRPLLLDDDEQPKKVYSDITWPVEIKLQPSPPPLPPSPPPILSCAPPLATKHRHRKRKRGCCSLFCAKSI